MHATPLDILAEELGAVSGRIEREAALRIDAAIADLRRIDAERELRLANLERAVADRLAAVKDGADADPDVIARLVSDQVERAVAALPKAKDGTSVTAEEVRPILEEMVAALPKAANGKDADPEFITRMVAEAVAALPPAPAGKDADTALIERMVADAVGRLPPAASGKDVDPEVIARLVGDAVAALPKPQNGKDGKMPVAREWADRVHYEGEIVAVNGSTYQASCDTGRAPPHSDWMCLAAAGRDGRSFTVRGTFAEDVADYRALDVVALGGAAFVARRDEPGACPGDGWQLISMQGKRGNPGELGAPGARGIPGPAVERLSINQQGILTVTNADGTAVECDLYPLLAKL